jgi:transforming growth factor-beta-induced protein
MNDNLNNNNESKVANYTPIIIGIIGALILGAIGYSMLNGNKTETTVATPKVVTIGGAAISPTKDLVDNLSSASNLATLVTALNSADLVTTLKSTGPFTVFAPSNDAFAALAPGTLTGLLAPESKTSLQELLKYHVIAGKVLSTDLKEGMAIATVQGEMLKVTKSGDKFLINGAEIETADALVSNGVAHVIKKVMTIPSEVTVGGATLSRRSDIVTNASLANNLTTLVTAVKAADLVETLQGPGPFTVFAPDNNGFLKLPAGTVEGLLKPESKDALAKILKYHVVSGSYLASSLKDGQILNTVQGQTLTVSIKEGKVMLKSTTGNTVMVSQADIVQSNGVVHVIDSVLLP